MHEFEVSVIKLTDNVEPTVGRLRDRMLSDLPATIRLFADSGLEGLTKAFGVEHIKVRKALYLAADVGVMELGKAAKYICATRCIQYGKLIPFIPCAQLHYRVEALINNRNHDLNLPVVQFRKSDCVYAKDTRNIHVVTPYGSVTLSLVDVNNVESAPLDDVPIPAFAVDRIFQTVEIYTVL